MHVLDHIAFSRPPSLEHCLGYTCHLVQSGEGKWLRDKLLKLQKAQEHFEAILFNVMRARGFEDDYVERYKMVTKFFQQRRPLIVLICGVPCTGMLISNESKLSFLEASRYPCSFCSCACVS